MGQPEKRVEAELKVSFSILAQKGLGLFTRTSVLNGRFLSEGEWARGEWEYARHVVTGRAGWPDYTGLVRRAADNTGVFVAVETKALYGELRTRQREMREWVESLGGVWVTPKSRHDFESVVWPIVGLPIPKRYEDFTRDGGEEVPF